MVCLACVTWGAGCGTADDPVDPHDLALRDLLGVAPRVAVAWDADQRAAAREVLAGGLRRDEALALPRLDGDGAAVVSGLVAIDRAREGDDEDALGLVVIAGDREARAIDGAIAGEALLGVVPGPMALELDPRAWPCASEPCDLTSLEALAADAAPGAAVVRVEPAAQLAVIAALVPGVDGVPTLLVNPIVTAVADDAEAAPGAGGAATATPRGAHRTAALPPPPLSRGAWTYGASVSACAERVRSDCDVCQTGGTCATVWPGVSGADACAMLDADESRNYHLVCVDLAVSLADVRACVQERSSACAIDVDAIDDPSQLAANAVFLDDLACANHLAVCLDQLYGPRDDADGCDACDGCSCDDDDNDSGGSCSNDDDMNDGCNDGGCNNDGCSGGGCNDSGSGGGCGGGGSGGNGSCAVASRSGRGPGLAIGLAWLLIPVPVALRARRRRRDDALTDDAPPL